MYRVPGRKERYCHLCRESKEYKEGYIKYHCKKLDREVHPAGSCEFWRMNNQLKLDL